MKTIFFNQRAMILCREGEQAEKDPEAVIVIDSGDDTILANAVNTIDTGSGIRRLYVLCDNPELTYERLRKLFTEVDAAGGLICNDLGEFLLIFRNGMWDLPKTGTASSCSSTPTGTRCVSAAVCPPGLRQKRASRGQHGCLPRKSRDMP